MTGPEARQIALSWALKDHGAWLDKWSADDVTNDVDGLPCYEKPLPVCCGQLIAIH
jgi:hypothetical protein